MAGANKTALDTQPLTQGYCWFTTEDGKFYIDALANQQDTTTLTRFVLNAEKADKDGDGNIIKNTYLPLAGGTLTGILKTTSTIQFQKTVNGTQRYITLKTVGPSITSTSGGITCNLDYYSFQISIPGFTSSGGSNGRTYVYRTPRIPISNQNVGGVTTTYYLASRNITATAGSKTTPVYCTAAGELINCDTYAGGTAVTLNGESKGASTASFYAPTTAGTLGQFLQSNGSEAPSWVDLDPGVKSISTGETNGTISVNTNDTITEVAVKGLGSNAFSSVAYLPLEGGTLTGDLSLSAGNTDRSINFLTGSTHKWRIQYAASGAGNDNRFNIQSTKATTDTWASALSIGCEDHDAIFSGAITAASFSGVGTSLTALNASNISSGTVAAARLPNATTSAKGAVKIGTGISVSSGTISVSGLAIAQASTPGEQYTLWIDTDEEAQAAMPLNGPKHKTFSITTGNWSGSGPYTYNLTMNGVTSSDAVIVLNLSASSQKYLIAQLDWETTSNTVKLSTSVKPTGTLSGYLITLPVTSV